MYPTLNQHISTFNYNLLYIKTSIH